MPHSQTSIHPYIFTPQMFPYMPHLASRLPQWPCLPVQDHINPNTSLYMDELEDEIIYLQSATRCGYLFMTAGRLDHPFWSIYKFGHWSKLG